MENVKITCAYWHSNPGPSNTQHINYTYWLQYSDSPLTTEWNIAVRYCMNTQHVLPLKSVHCAHIVYLCVPIASQNKQSLFTERLLTSWYLQWAMALEAFCLPRPFALFNGHAACLLWGRYWIYKYEVAQRALQYIFTSAETQCPAATAVSSFRSGFALLSFFFGAGMKIKLSLCRLWRRIGGTEV